MILAIDQGTTGTTCLVFDREGRIRGRAYSEFRQHFPRPGLGRARRERDLGGDQAGRLARARRREGRPGAASTRSGSPTSARPSSPGTRRPASRSTTRSSGRTGAPRRAATSCARPGTSRWSASAPGWSSTPTSPATKIEWLLRNVDAAARRRLRHDRLVARLQAHRPPRDRLLERLADDAVRHPRAPLGPGALRAARRRSRRRCPSRCPRPASSAPPPSSAARSRSPGSPATSRRRCSARPATRPGMAKNTYGTGSFVLLNAGGEVPDAGARGC